MLVLPFPDGPVMKRLRREFATNPRVCTVVSGRTSPDMADRTASERTGSRAALWRTTISLYAGSDTGAGPI
jgi:hypothetical protein